MINPAPLPSGYYMVRGIEIEGLPQFAIRLTEEKDNNEVSIKYSVLTQNNKLLAYENGWQESDYDSDEALAIVDDIIRQKYSYYYEGIEIDAVFNAISEPMIIYIPPLEQFRGVIDASAELSENYPVLADPAPVVCGFFSVESETNPTLSGLCVEIKAFKSVNTNYVEVHASMLMSGGDYVAYKNGAFTTIANGTEGVRDFIGNAANAYALASLAGTDYTLGNFNIDSNVTLAHLPSAKFITKIQAT